MENKRIKVMTRVELANYIKNNGFTAASFAREIGYNPKMLAKVTSFTYKINKDLERKLEAYFKRAKKEEKTSN